MELKKDLATTIVTEMHNAKDAVKAAIHFKNTVQSKEVPLDIPEVKPFTSERLVTSESINAPAAVTFVVSVTSALASIPKSERTSAAVLASTVFESVNLAYSPALTVPVVSIVPLPTVAPASAAG